MQLILPLVSKRSEELMAIVEEIQELPPETLEELEEVKQKLSDWVKKVDNILNLVGDLEEY